MIPPIIRLLTLAVPLWGVAGAQARVADPPLADWRSFEIPQSRTSLDYPAGIFSPAGASGTGVGERFQSHDQGATLSVYVQPRKADETSASYLQNNLQIPPSAIEYRRVTRTFSRSRWSAEERSITADAISQPASHCIVSIWRIRNGKSGHGTRS
jgi:hypothetical protein